MYSNNATDENTDNEESDDNLRGYEFAFEDQSDLDEEEL